MVLQNSLLNWCYIVDWLMQIYVSKNVFYNKRSALLCVGLIYPFVFKILILNSYGMDYGESRAAKDLWGI